MKEINPKLKSWASIIDDKTIEQANKTAELSIVDGHVALMPDAHFGYGSTVGSVIPTKNAVIPSAIGVDIGCGMIAAEMPFTSKALPENLDALHEAICRVVPAGMGEGHDQATGNTPREKVWHHFTNSVKSPSMTVKQSNTAFQQFGSLGGGNHFVEVCLDERDYVWVVLHSGSRGIGNQLATEHIDKAKGMAKAAMLSLPDIDLAYLTEGTPEFTAYIEAMLWAQAYAFENRQVMMDAVLQQVGLTVVQDYGKVIQTINCHHNFTVREKHGGKDLWITRKGAIRAGKGDLGIIPGSMATGTYIVSGLGSVESYESCSHGAGRVLSRNAARKTLTTDSLREAMKGKAWNDEDAEALIDESPAAYKSIESVMDDQKDLVKVEHHLTQILNYKGVDRKRHR